MVNSKNSGSFLAVALAALSLMLWPAVSRAQQHSYDDGHANDANNSTISGGYNVQPKSIIVDPANSSSQRMVYGNVMGGKAFRGNTPYYGDPKAFHGVTAGAMNDTFVKNSAGVPLPNQAALPINAALPFYGQSQYVAPPQGYTAAPGNSGYIPAIPMQRTIADQRLNVIPETATANLPRPAELVMPGPIDNNTNQQTVMAASPLYGIRQLSPGDMSDQYFLSKYTNLRQDGAIDRTRYDPRLIQRMRDELIDQPRPVTPAPKSESNSNDFSLGSPLPKPADAPRDPSMGMKPMDASVTGNGEAIRNRVLSSPVAQSTQYAALRRRLEEMYGKTMNSQVLDAQVYNAALAGRNKVEAKGPAVTPGTVTNPVATPDKGKTPLENAGMTDYGKEAQRIVGEAGKHKVGMAPGDVGQSPVQKPKPLVVASLAAGVQGKLLGDTMRKAEELMKQGKFTEAIDQYDIAEMAAPNNSLIWLGRATAELGGAFYGLAERHLRQALVADPTLLMGQYDLKAMIGEDRLEIVTTDLKEIARKDERVVTPILLLAYISYNSGNERRALGYLDLAEKRAGAADSLVQTLRKHWTLPDAATSQPAVPLEMNK